VTHVLMTADTVGGVWTYALETAGALAAHGVDVSLATMGGAMTAAQRRAVAASAVVEVHESTFALEWMDEPWIDVERAGEWLLDLARQSRPDVVHLGGYVHAALPWPAPTVVVAHSCVLSWWQAVHGTPAPAVWDRYRQRARAGLAAADAVVAPTAAMLAAVREWYGVAGGTVVPNCRSSDWVVPRPKQRLVLGAGRVWDEAKNLALLDAVAGRLPWEVVIAGERRHPGTGAEDGPAGPASTPSARLLGQVSFDELAPWLLRASVFVAPARYEPFGLGVLEAGLAGCALVLGDIPSLREVWADAALYIDPDDAEGLEAVLTELTGDPRLVDDLGRRARARARTFTPERTARGYLDVYRHLPVAAGGAW
jgi:glycogen(starch) synthase